MITLQQALLIALFYFLILNPWFTMAANQLRNPVCIGIFLELSWVIQSKEQYWAV